MASAITANQVRTVLDRLFKDGAKPTMFLSSFASVRKTSAAAIAVDILRNKEEYAVDIIPGAGSRSNKKARWTTKEYIPPLYSESDSLTAQELQKRLPGVNAFDQSDMSYATQAIKIASDKQIDLQDKILRAIELQARDAYFSGQIELLNGDTIDFKKKTTHGITPTTDWADATGTPLDDISDACALIRKDGLVQANRYRLIVADDVVEVLKANAQMVEKANLRRVNNVEMDRVSDINDLGAVRHGEFDAGRYIIELWTYPQFYDVPEGFGFANEGTKQPYIPSGEALLLPAGGIDLRLWFAGVPTMLNQVEPEAAAAVGGLSVPTLAEADFVPWIIGDDRKKCIELGVDSAPLFVPVQIDGFCTFDTLLG
ncbi:MAG: major capsid protein [Phycisphaerales bacterium JB058]